MAKKSLGQHFLIDTRVAARQISYASLQPDDVVLEIGPGKGVLTRLLAEHVKQVVAVEIDSRLVKELTQWVPKNVCLVHADILDVDFQTLPFFTKIVANLPFQISSPITFKLLNYKFSKAILMYQKDFAERMIAQVGSKQYSRLSVGISFKACCRILETVPKNCFSPQPKVKSCVVELIPREQPPFSVIDEAFFFNVTKILFTHRRKKIKNNILEAFGTIGENLPYLDQRVEELTPEEIGKFSNLLYAAVHYKK